MKDIQLLAAVGYFPKRLSQCDRPQCGSCQFGKSIKNHRDPGQAMTKRY